MKCGGEDEERWRKIDLTLCPGGAHDFYQPACPLRIDGIPGRTVYLQMGSDDDAVGGRENLRGVLVIDAGIGEHRDVARALLRLPELGQVDRSPGLRPADQQRVGAEE